MAEDDLGRLVAAIRQSRKYKDVSPALIMRIGRQELLLRKNLKAAIKSSKNKLHQIGGAYYADKRMDAAAFQNQLRDARQNPETLQAFCRQVMGLHSSTRERLPFLADFYREIFAALPPIHSVLDLACGLNPLAAPWMPLPAQASYTAVDIYADMLQLADLFFREMGLNGRVLQRDLLTEEVDTAVDLALILKTLPCLEQIDKDAASLVLAKIQARFILISYPLQSLGGRSKGMFAHYQAHFAALDARFKWRHVTQLEFPAELVFLVEA